MKPLRNLIKKVDYFSENINLEFGGQQKFETALGGLLSIIICLLTIALLVSQAIILYERNTPNTNQAILFIESPRKIDIELNYLRFAWGLNFGAGQERFHDISYFTYSLNKLIMDRTSGVLVRKEVPVEFDLCKNHPKRFETDKFNYTDAAKLYKIEGLWCLKDNNGSIEGNFNNDYFENFKIKVCVYYM